MNRAGLIVVVAALVVAVATAWTPAQAQEQRNPTIVVAQLIDASVKSAPLLSKHAQDDAQMKMILDGRDVQIINLNELVNDEQAEMLSDLLNGSEVLRQNTLLVRSVAKDGSPLARALEDHGIHADQVVAVNLTDDTDQPLTVYIFDD